MSAFYKIDSTKFSHLEYFWWHKSPMVIISWLHKWFRIPVNCSSDDPNTESTLPFVAEGFPEDIVAGFEPLANELAALGFLDPVYHVIYDAGTRTTLYWATLRHTSGNHFARIHQRNWDQAANPKRAFFPMIFTEFTDGTFLVSSAGKPDMAAPKTVVMNRMYRASPAQLWQKHQELAAKISERKMISPVRSSPDLIAATERHHVLVRDFHLARGVFRPRTAEDEAQVKSYATAVATAQAGGFQYAEILAELQKLQEQKSSWAATVPILIISLLLFVMVGVAKWNWQYTLLIIPVLFFHECGHWLAMRIFHYRNLRMFFIPFFGAAVTGRNWNVPGWKKAIVFLAGPLPGIALGIFLGVAAMAWKLPMLNKAAMLLVIINGYNLLPILPLDGGQVLLTVLFCRNRWLDVVFRILAVGGLLLLSVARLGGVFLYVAILMGVALPLAFKLAHVSDNLRKQQLPEPQPNEDRIPTSTAEAIITELKAAFPKNTSNKTIAQHTLSVFETLNAKPPGVLGTVGLIAVHGGALLVAVIFGAVFTFSNVGGFGDFARAAMHQPRHGFKCGDTQQWQGTEAAANPAASHNLLVANFKRHDQAAAEFSVLSAQLPPTSRLALFGDSLLLSLPASDDAARNKYFDELQLATTNVFVAISNQPVMLNLQGVAQSADEASNLVQDLQFYFANPTIMQLVPPWSPEFEFPAFAAKRQAREAWNQIGEAVSHAGDTPAIKDYARRIMRADNRGARSEVAVLEKEEQELTTDLESQARAKLRANATNPQVPVLVDLNAALATVDLTNEVARAPLLRQVAARLGEVRYDGEKPAPEAQANGASMGVAEQHSLMVEMTWVELNDPVVSLPALANWLCDRHCVGVKYDLSQFSGFGDD